MSENNLNLLPYGSVLKLRPKEIESPKPQDKKEVVEITYTNQIPLEKNNLELNPDTEIYKVTTYKNANKEIEKVLKINVPELNKDITPAQNEAILDYNATSKTPSILKPGFNIKDRVRNINNKWKESPVYKNLSEKVQFEIEKNNDMKLMYRNIALNNLAGIGIGIGNGTITPEMLNANNGLALNMVIANGDLEMAKTLFNGGCSPHGIDPRNCYSEEMAQVITQEQYKLNNPVASTLRESLGLGTPRPRWSQNL